MKVQGEREGRDFEKKKKEKTKVEMEAASSSRCTVHLT